MAKGPGQQAADHLADQWDRFYNRVLPKVIANEAKELFIRNFDQEAFFGRSWRRPIGMGDSDIRRDPNDPILEQDAEIRGNIDVISSTPRSIRVGVRGIVYADIHNRGGRIPVTKRSRRFFWAKSAEASSPRAKQFWRNMALNTKGFVRMPRRQFIGHHYKLVNRLTKVVEKELNRFNQQL